MDGVIEGWRVDYWQMSAAWDIAAGSWLGGGGRDMWPHSTAWNQSSKNGQRWIPCVETVQQAE